MTDTLLPCPFCGSTDVDVQGKPAILDALDSVCCNECTADAPHLVWNTRAPAQPAQVPTVEQVENAVGMGSAAWDCVDPKEIIAASQPSDDVAKDAWKQAVDNVGGYAHLYSSGIGVVLEIKAEHARIIAENKP